MQTSKGIMAVFAHADDVELGCGGTLSKYRQLSGYRVDYIMSTNNMSGSWCSLDADGKLQSRKCSWREMMPQRKKEADAAAEKFYGTGRRKKSVARVFLTPGKGKITSGGSVCSSRSRRSRTDPGEDSSPGL